MEQQQFKVRFPLRYKFLLSVVLLAILVITFVTSTTLHLFSQDRENYILQGQNTEASIARTAFHGLAARTFNFLTLSLKTVSRGKKISPRRKKALETTLQTQPVDDSRTEVIGLTVKYVNPQSGKTNRKLLNLVNQSRIAELGLQKKDLEVTEAWLRPQIKQLWQNGVTFINISKKSKARKLMAIIVGDFQNRNDKDGLLVAIGVVSLDRFLSQFQSSRISILTETGGWVLFDTDPEVQFSRRNVKNDPFYKIVHKLPQKIKNLGTGTHRFAEAEEEYLGSYSIFSIAPPKGMASGLDKNKVAKASVYLTVRSSWDQVSSVIKDLVAKVIIFSGMAVGAAIIFAILFAKNITAPLSKLFNATKEVARGNFSLSLKTKSSDEIGALSTSFTTMSNKISDLIEEQKEKTRMEGELEIATQVQHTLIPPDQFENENLMIKSYYKSASECGGDWWGFFTQEKKAAFFIADATGHGLPSALITAAARSCFSVLEKICQENPQFMNSPGNMLRYANRAIHEAALGKIMMTFFAGVADFSSGSLTYASAGHNPPWLFQKQEDRYKMLSLTAKGVRLGESLDVDVYAERKVSFSPEDILFLYTDGILEGTNDKGAQYGKKQTRKIIENSLTKGPQGVVSSLMDDFWTHNGEKPLDDDITLAVAQFRQGA